MLETHSLGKSYALNPVLREVESLLRILAGLEAPSAGRAMVFGQDTRRLAAQYRRRIGVMTHQSLLYPNLTARENLEFYAELYNVAEPRALSERWLSRVGLVPYAGTRVRAFSRGMEQRLAIARAMLHEPALLLLDEPFAALDADGVSLVASLIRDALDRGAAVLVTAHSVPEIERVAFEVFEIVRGRVLPLSNHEEVSSSGRIRSLLGRWSR